MIGEDVPSRKGGCAMFQSLQKLAEKIGSLIGERPFSCGVLTGLAIAAAILLFLLLLCLAFRSRKLRCIVVPSEGGELRIDAKAVQDAVRAVAAGFPAFDVRRVGLYGKQKDIELKVAMDFNGGDVSISDLAVQFRGAVAHMMTETFGMERPGRIGIEILRSGADIDVSASGENEATSAPADDSPGDSPSAASGEPSVSEPGRPC